ncbi:MAG: hypothetical protein AVO34_00780 [Firmicutes bacterium ML8_F2]|jgi:hypothetical protein|nr:MAG: hypothetical protein AVO34_00780 [Firmicutes bacterium ML8_F2]
MVTAGGNNFPDSTAGIDYITVVARDDMNVKMEYGLPGIEPDIGTDVVAVGAKFFLQLLADIENQVDHGGVFFRGSGKILFHMPFGDYQAVPPANRAGIVKGQGQVIFSNNI